MTSQEIQLQKQEILKEIGQDWIPKEKSSADFTHGEMQSDVECWIIDSVRSQNNDVDALIDDLWQIQRIRYETEHRRQTACKTSRVRARLATHTPIQRARHL